MNRESNTESNELTNNSILETLNLQEKVKSIENFPFVLLKDKGGQLNWKSLLAELCIRSDVPLGIILEKNLLFTLVPTSL